MPGVAVAEELLALSPRCRVLFVGTGAAVERRVLAERGFRHEVLAVAPSTTLRRRPLRFVWRNWRAYRAAVRVLQRERPAVVVGLGGFASAPAVLAAAALRIPVVLLEQNVLPGRANRWLSRRADVMCLSFPVTIRDGLRARRITVTGNPVRREIAALHGCDPSSPIPYPSSIEHTLLVLGGSGGAAALNEAVARSLPALTGELSGWHIVHQTGESDLERTRRLYHGSGLTARVAAFLPDIADWYQRSDLVISRAGGTTLAEIACAGCPSVLIPDPRALDDHQRYNAESYAKAGAAAIVRQEVDAVATSEELVRRLRPLAADRKLRGRMQERLRRLARPRAASDVCGLIVEAAHSAAGKRAA